MIDNAKNIPCDILINPADGKYSENIRKFQGCPTIAVSRGGRLFAAWYSGGIREPHIDNYNLIVYSDDDGNTWSKPVVVIPGSRERLTHSLDIQLWTAPNGSLHVYWVQNNVCLPSKTYAENEIHELFELEGKGWYSDGYDFTDFRHAMWRIICDAPDADELTFSAPEYLDTGFLRCKPVVTMSGRQINCNYDQLCDRYGYSISDDNSKTFKRLYGGKKIGVSFDETMVYQCNDGVLRMFARSPEREIIQSFSYDDGLTWTDGEKSGIISPDTRFYVSRTPSGKVILVNNDCKETRSRMSVWLSDDDGESWKYKKVIDDRNGISYPDVDFYDGKVYLVYDRSRTGEKEILFCKFTEDDIISGNDIEISIISKP